MPEQLLHCLERLHSDVGRWEALKRVMENVLDRAPVLPCGRARVHTTLACLAREWQKK